MKTRVVLFVRSCLAVLVEHRLVTDTDIDRQTQTDEQTRTQGDSIYRASISSRGKNRWYEVGGLVGVGGNV